jgi:hypothetical protein
MVVRPISLLAALAFTANATQYSNSTITSATPYVTTTTADVVVYTTVCPATSLITSGTKTLTSTYITTSTITSCKGGCPTAPAKPDCDKVRSDCQSKPDANQAECAALYVQCARTTSSLNHPPVSNTSTAATPSATADCEKVRFDCQSMPDANQAVCAALYVRCAGATSNLNHPPTISTASAPTSSDTQDCNKVRSDCQSKPDANQAVCAALYVQCAGTTSGLNKPAPSATTQDTTVYTTVCPATSVVSGKTSVYITTSTITSCKGGCPSSALPQASTATLAASSSKLAGSASVQTTLATSAATNSAASSKSVQSAQSVTTPGATSSKTVQSAPSATTSSVNFTGAASSFKVEYAGLAGFAMFFLM